MREIVLNRCVNHLNDEDRVKYVIGTFDFDGSDSYNAEDLVSTTMGWIHACATSIQEENQ